MVRGEHNWAREDISPGQLFKLLRSRPRSANSGKLKQTELAARVLVDVRAVQQWENGERLPSAENLKKVLRIFLEEGIFLSRREREEARWLWESVRRAYHQRPGSTRIYPPFDDAWFEALLVERDQKLSSRTVPSSDSTKITQPETAHTNIPLPLTGFVGRERELVEIKQLLNSTRLLTLTGPGGCGKTRLTIEMARDLSEYYPDGVRFVDLSTASEPALLLERVAMALDVYEVPDRSLKQALEAWLRHKRMLLILDNCEHLIDVCAAAIETWLQSCPSLSILVTSRELLHIAGEHVFSLVPLPVPVIDNSAHDLVLSEIESYDSVRLFVERTRALLPSFGLTAENVQGIIEICRRLDGLPLALELAAARMNTLSVQQLAARLSEPLSLLQQGSRTAPVQRQTLRASIDWSYRWLNKEEQGLFQQVSVFAGGWTLDALEAIYRPQEYGRGNGSALPGGGGRSPRPRARQSHCPFHTPVEQNDVLSLLASLVAKSLIVVQRVGQDDVPRYRLLETIRQYAQERLEESKSEDDILDLYKRYSWHYVHFVEEIEPYLRSDQRTRGLQRLLAEYENIRRALSWCRSHDIGKEPGLRMVAALYWFWLHQGFWSEGRRWLEELLQLTCAGDIGRDHVGTYAKAAHGAGLFAWAQGDLDEAARLAVESVTEARKANNHIVLAACLRLYSLVLQKQGHDDQALALAEESVMRAQGDAWSLATSLNMLGTIMRMQGKSKRASELYEESIVLLREVGDRWELSAPLRNLGSLLMDEGDYQRAHALYRESLTCCQEMKGRWFLSRSLEDMALLLSKRGDVQRAATILGAAEALRETLGASVMPFSSQAYEQSLDILHQQLSAEIFAQCWQAGRAMNIEQAIAYAKDL